MSVFKRIRHRFRSEKGQAMVEFALVMPIFLLILCGILDYGWMYYNQLSLNNECRAAVRYIVVSTPDDGDTHDLEAYVKHTMTVNFRNDVNISIVYSDTHEPLLGDVTLTFSTYVPSITPVYGIINGENGKDVTSQIVMKVES